MPSHLQEARLQAHWAAQLASAPGTTLLPSRDDNGHTNLTWSDTRGALCGRPVDGRCAELHIGELTLAVGDREFALQGNTYNDAMAWLSEQFGADLHRSSHTMPEHTIGEGRPFCRVPELAELEEHYARAHTALTALELPVYCWPHHFDIAVLRDLGQGRSVGAGLSPGDDSYPNPYWYVTPWPYTKDPEALPKLATGAWHIDGWIGAVLPGSADPAEFLVEATTLVAKLLEGADGD